MARSTSTRLLITGAGGFVGAAVARAALAAGHEPIALVGEWLRKVITGYYQYHAVPGNLPRLNLFRWRLRWVWWRALSRRGQRRRVPLDRLSRLVDRWIPVPRVVHPYPRERFDATHSRWKPYA